MKHFVSNAALEIKQYFGDLLIVLGVSYVTQLWHAIKAEADVFLVAHLVVTMALLIFVRIVGRWVAEEIDDISNVDYIQFFPARPEAFEALKDIEVHKKMYRQNIGGEIYDTNKLKIYSKFIGIKSMETFEVIITDNVVKLVNVSGSYESSVTYERGEFGITANWIAKPRGIRRALILFFRNHALKTTIEDFKKFCSKY